MTLSSCIILLRKSPKLQWSYNNYILVHIIITPIVTKYNLMKLIVFFKLFCYIYFNRKEIFEKVMQEGINLANNDSESNARKSPEMEDITKRFFCTRRGTGTKFENEKTYRHETICRISRRILQLNFYHALVFLYL